VGRENCLYLGSILRYFLHCAIDFKRTFQARGIGLMLATSDVVEFFLKLEGPYKWYAIGVVLVLLTALVTRFIFKTIKWFVIIAAVAALAYAMIYYLNEYNLLPIN
jgi:hypothetical protein